MTDTIQMIIAITLASFLSHISLLLLLGRHEELHRGVEMITNRLAGGCGSHQIYDPPTHQQPHAPRLIHPMCDDTPMNIPQAIPAGSHNYGAPVDWQNPGAGSIPQNRPHRQGANGNTFTQNWYM